MDSLIQFSYVVAAALFILASNCSVRQLPPGAAI